MMPAFGAHSALSRHAGESNSAGWVRGADGYEAAVNSGQYRTYVGEHSLPTWYTRGALGSTIRRVSHDPSSPSEERNPEGLRSISRQRRNRHRIAGTSTRRTSERTWVGSWTVPNCGGYRWVSAVRKVDAPPGRREQVSDAEGQSPKPLEGKVSGVIRHASPPC